MTHFRSIAGALALCLALGPLTPAVAAVDDRYLTGYATAVLERQFGLTIRTLRVREGVLTVGAEDLGDAARRDEVVKALSAIDGVKRVQVLEAASGAAPVAVSTSTATAGWKAPDTGVMPGGHLFNPLIADPRWPHFAASYQYYFDDPGLASAGTVSFGETFSLYRGAAGPGYWELGVQAGVFALFDLDSSSKDLFNADYFVAGFAAYRLDRFSAFTRIFHQSSHLGDEFLLRTRTERINLSYEGVDAKLSIELFDWLRNDYEHGTPVRFYAGGGYLFHVEPSGIRPWSAQYGLELRSPWTIGRSVRPVAAVDVQHREENDWAADISVRAGIQIDGVLLTRNMQILLEWYQGHSPNGQFFRQRIEYLGLGVHFHF